MCFISIQYGAQAQQFVPKWVADLGGPSASGDDVTCGVVDVAVDNQNNVYVTGSFNGTVDFDPSPAVKNLTSGGTATFVGKYKPDGTLIWVESIGANDSEDATVVAASGIAVDKEGNISITGGNDSPFDADPGPGVHNLSGGAFLIHLDNNGGFLWAYAVGDASLRGGEQVVADGEDNVIVTSNFSKAVTIGDTTYAAPPQPKEGQPIYHGLIVKYSPTGNVIWSICIGNTDLRSESAFGCRVDSQDNIVISGAFNETVNFNPLGPAYNVTATTISEAYVAKYSSFGGLMWVNVINMPVLDFFFSNESRIGIDSQNNAYFTTSFAQPVTVGGSVILNPKGAQDVAIVKYSTTGVLQYAKSIGGPGAYAANGKTVGDKNGNIYLSGAFSTDNTSIVTVNFNPNPGPAENLSTGPQQEEIFYVAEYDPNGNYIDAFDGGRPSGYRSVALCLAIDNNNNLDVGGEFSTTVNFDPSGCSADSLTAKTSFPLWDGFIVQYSPGIISNNVITAPLVSTFCASGIPAAIMGSTPSGGTGAYTYQWQSSTDSLNFNNIPGADSINYMPALLNATTFYRRNVSASCATPLVSNIVGLHVSSPPVAPQAAGDTICTGATTTLSITSPQAGLTYSWYASATGDTSLFTGLSFTTPAITANTTFYTAAINAAGCNSATRTAVTVTILQALPAPLVTVGAITPTSVSFQWTAVPGATGYQVSIDSGKTFTSPSSGADSLSTTVSGLQPEASVTLIVESLGTLPCEVSASSVPVTGTIPPSELIYVPNAFTPNGDGINDVVHVHSESIANLTFHIYDQWGELLFTSTSVQNGWDGTYKGKKEPVGVYVYYLQATMNDGNKVNQKGTITLLK